MYSQSVPMCPGCPVYVYSSSLLCEKIDPLLVSQNSPVKARVLYSALPPCCEMWCCEMMTLLGLT